MAPRTGTGPTLRALRERIETLATPTGRYHVVCARTGECPVPAAGWRFPTEASARVAAALTARYRATLRRYDPELARTEPVGRAIRSHPRSDDGVGGSSPAPVPKGGDRS